MARPAGSYRANRPPQAKVSPVRDASFVGVLRSGKVYPQHGDREHRRFARQIAAGSLTAANGLRAP